MCCGVLGVVALAAAGRRSMDCGCGCGCCRERFEPRTNVIRMTEPACGCECDCCCRNTSEQSAAASVSCEAVEAFKQASAERSSRENCDSGRENRCSGRENRRSCGCR